MAQEDKKHGALMAEIERLKAEVVAERDNNKSLSSCLLCGGQGMYCSRCYMKKAEELERLKEENANLRGESQAAQMASDHDHDAEVGPLREMVEAVNWVDDKIIPAALRDYRKRKKKGAGDSPDSKPDSAEDDGLLAP